MATLDPGIISGAVRALAAPQKPKSKRKPRRGPIPVPRNPLNPWSPQLIDQETERRLNAIFGPMEESIRRRSATDTETALRAAQASAALMAPIAARTQEIYDQAGKETAGLAQGYTGQERAAFEAQQAAARAEAERLGIPYAPGANPAELANQAFRTTGEIPSSNLYAQGANAAQQAAALPAGAALEGQSEIMDIRRKTDDDLLELANKRPEMRNQVMDELWKRELEKMSARNQQRQIAIQEHAQKLYERQFGETVRSHKARESEAIRSHRARERQAQQNYKLQVTKHQAAMDRAAAEGRRPDASLSGKYGYIVDADGQPIRDKNGNKIPVAAGKAGSGNKGLTPDQRRTNQRMAGEAARGMYEDSRPTPGPYGTTGPPKHKWTFPAAQSYLMATYGLTRAQARRLLIAAGFKPTGKPRPNPATTGNAGGPGGR